MPGFEPPTSRPDTSWLEGRQAWASPRCCSARSGCCSLVLTVAGLLAPQGRPLPARRRRSRRRVPGGVLADPALPAAHPVTPRGRCRHRAHDRHAAAAPRAHRPGGRSTSTSTTPSGRGGTIEVELSTEWLRGRRVAPLSYGSVARPRSAAFDLTRRRGAARRSAPVTGAAGPTSARVRALGYNGVMKFGISTFITDDGIRPDTLGRAVEVRGSARSSSPSTPTSGQRESPYPGGGDLPRKYYRTLDPFVALTAVAAATRRCGSARHRPAAPARRVPHRQRGREPRRGLGGPVRVRRRGRVEPRGVCATHGTDPRTRGALMDEQLAALKEIWTAEEAEYHGTHVDFDPITMWPKPVQRPHPPIYVGGESEAALRRLATLGDGWLPRAGTPPRRSPGSVGGSPTRVGRTSASPPSACRPTPS